MFFQSILVRIYPVRYQLDKQIIRWVENCLDSWTPRVVTSYTNSSWQPVSNGIPQGSILAPTPFNIAINGLHNEAVHTLSKLVDDTKRARGGHQHSRCVPW